MKKLGGERGQALTELVLLLPIFLILVFAIVDFGMGFHSYITVTNSAREGARLGAVGGSSAAIAQRVRDTASTLDQGNLTVTVTNAQGPVGQSVTVKADYQYNLITPLTGLMSFVSGGSIGPTLDVTSTAEMRLE
ncbi:MAG: pilus assembly protein [Dehalococcoidia bacterium]|nr:pilus assembly protein [Dehalococcoidia bacterium]